MATLAANLTMLFTELPFLERFAAAQAAGFKYVEFLFPYDHAPEQIKQRLDANGLTLVLHNLPAGDWSAGERGIAADPARKAEFEAGGRRWWLTSGLPGRHWLRPGSNCLWSRSTISISRASC